MAVISGPEMRGAAAPGETLFAHPGEWESGSGSAIAFSYQWERGVLGEFAAIAGAAGAAYDVGLDDVGSFLRVRVTARAGDPAEEVTAVSEAFPILANGPGEVLRSGRWRDEVPVFEPGGADLIVNSGDGGFFIAGAVRRSRAQPVERVLRLNARGIVVPWFPRLEFEGHAGAEPEIMMLAPLPGGGLAVGGSFASVNGIACSNRVVLGADGLPHASFACDVEVDGPVTGVFPAPDGGLMIAGTFSHIGGAPAPNIARLRPGGSPDPSFVPELERPAGLSPDVPLVVACEFLPDGRMVLGGRFISIDGIPRPGLAMLNADGSVDASFAPEGIEFPLGSSISVILILGDGDPKKGSVIEYCPCLPCGCASVLPCDEGRLLLMIGFDARRGSGRAVSHAPAGGISLRLTRRIGVADFILPEPEVSSDLRTWLPVSNPNTPAALERAGTVFHGDGIVTDTFIIDAAAVPQYFIRRPPPAIEPESFCVTLRIAHGPPRVGWRAGSD